MWTVYVPKKWLLNWFLEYWRSRSTQYGAVACNTSAGQFRLTLCVQNLRSFVQYKIRVNFLPDFFWKFLIGVRSFERWASTRIRRALLSLNVLLRLFVDELQKHLVTIFISCWVQLSWFVHISNYQLLFRTLFDFILICGLVLVLVNNFA